MTKGSPPTVFRTFTPTVLQAYSGKDGGSVYLALAGQVFDVTPGKGFYGPVRSLNMCECEMLFLSLLS